MVALPTAAGPRDRRSSPLFLGSQKTLFSWSEMARTGGRNRTHDRRLWRPLLYQLSYARKSNIARLPSPRTVAGARPNDRPEDPTGAGDEKAASPGGGRAAAETVTASAVSPAHSRGAPLRGSSHAPRLEALAPRLGYAGSIESRNMCGQVSALGGLPHHLDPLSCVPPADSLNSRAHPPR